jgi:hypothetical protein
MLSSEGYRLAVFFSKAYRGVVNPTVELDPPRGRVTNRHPIARTWRTYEHELEARVGAAILTS